MDDIKCPECNSGEVRSYDNFPLFHPTKHEVEVEGQPRFDTEIYTRAICDNCNHKFQVEGKISYHIYK